MDTQKKLSAPIFIIIAALLWSLDGLLRRSLYTVSPAIIVFWEHALGAVILLPFVWKYLKDIKQLTKKEWLAILAVSLFSGALGTIFYTAALGKVHYIQFSVVVLLQQLQPIWAIGMAAILLKERISGKFALWAVLAIVGSYFVTFRDLRINLDTGSETVIAALLALGAGIMWGTSTSFSKIVLKKTSYHIATFLRFVLAPVFAFLFIAYLRQVPAMFTLASGQWKTLLAITLSTGMVALLIYYYGLRHTEAKVSAICELVWPASAIFIDYFYFKSTLSWTQMIGVVVVIYSIYKVSSLQNKATPNEIPMVQS
ncbi:MAG: DMT family transporter [bacterium]|nr:DMT family transporter [bacterium]